MTVVNMLSFGDSGAGIADEQTSGYIRKSNIANKLKEIGGFIFGSSGSLNFIANVYSRLEIILPEKPDLNKLKECLLKETVNFISEFKEGIFYKNFSYSLKEVETQKFDDEIRKRMNECFDKLNTEISQNTIVVGGMVNNKFNTYFFDFSNCSLMYNALPFISIGSGSDEANRILSRYIEKKPKEERKKINKVEGLIKLIEAANEASIANLGVGGAPQIIYCNQNGTKEIEEEKCILASEIVKGYSFEQLNKDSVYEAINNLIFGEAKSKEIEEQMKSKAKDWDKLDKLLRGYKV